MIKLTAWGTAAVALAGSLFSLWCMMASPLIAGNDLRRMTSATARILTNLEAIAFDQDPLGVQGRVVRRDGPVEIWAGKPLFDAIARELGPLPIVAEDLGYITPDVHALRDALDYPGMKILQFAFGGDADHLYLPHNYPRHCVVYSGTHDNDTVRGWRDRAGENERRFAGTYLACGAHDVHWALIRAALNSLADLAVFPLQDVLGRGQISRGC